MNLFVRMKLARQRRLSILYGPEDIQVYTDERK